MERAVAGNLRDIRSEMLKKYKLPNKPDYCVCQMCKKAKLHNMMEVNNIIVTPHYHWDQCRVALCLECSAQFKHFRDSEKGYAYERFLSAIKKADCNVNHAIEISLGNEKITFRQKHLAMVQYILNHQDD